MPNVLADDPEDEVRGAAVPQELDRSEDVDIGRIRDCERILRGNIPFRERLEPCLDEAVPDLLVGGWAYEGLELCHTHGVSPESESRGVPDSRAA